MFANSNAAYLIFISLLSYVIVPSTLGLTSIKKIKKTQGLMRMLHQPNETGVKSIYNHSFVGKTR